MTAKEYHELVATYDARKLQTQIDAIPLNINRAGRLYRKLIKEIYDEIQTSRRHKFCTNQ